MSLQYIHQNFIKYNKGKGYICCQVEALHAVPPAADKYTDRIAERVMMKTGCAGIISTVSRRDCDLNRSPNGINDRGIIEYRNAVKDILNSLQIVDESNHNLTASYLHLSFHGMKDEHYGPFGIEIGTLKGLTCSPKVKTWFKESLINKSTAIFPELNIVFDKKFSGSKSIGAHRNGDSKDYPGYGNHFHTFQIEISRTLRRKHRSKIIDLFSEIIMDFQLKLGTFD